MKYKYIATRIKGEDLVLIASRRGKLSILLEKVWYPFIVFFLVPPKEKTSHWVLVRR